jgi:uncharacterized peroxidase-related enzyme
MIRMTSIDPATATGRTKELLDSTQSQLGRTPNLYRSMAHSPAALEGYLAFRGSLIKGALSSQMRERIALLTATINDCGYCVAAHCFRGAKAGLSESELVATRKNQSDDAKTQAALQFVTTLIEHRGLTSESEFVNVKSLGWSDEEIGEIVAHVALNVFSNYFNHVAQPELDFPKV